MVFGLPRFDRDTERRFILWRSDRLRDILPIPITVGAFALLGFVVWDWALDADAFAAAFTIRICASVIMLYCAWRIANDRTARLTPLTFLASASGTIAIAWTQALVDQGFVYGSAGLALFPTVSAILVTRARDVPLVNAPPFLVVLGLLWLEGVQGFTLFNVIAFLGTGVFTAWIVAMSLEQAARQSFRLELTLEAEARLDVLTGIANRRQLEEQAAIEVERCRRFGRPLSLLVIDVDHFKRVNDNHGHAVGDEVLRVLADLCRRQMRQTDLFARMGGEEFVALLPETEIEDATVLAERLRRVVADAPLVRDEVALHVTISIGIARCDRSEGSWERMLAAADRALYAAKEQGRNRVLRADRLAPGAPATTA